MWWLLYSGEVMCRRWKRFTSLSSACHQCFDVKNKMCLAPLVVGRPGTHDWRLDIYHCLLCWMWNVKRHDLCVVLFRLYLEITEKRRGSILSFFLQVLIDKNSLYWLTEQTFSLVLWLYRQRPCSAVVLWKVQQGDGHPYTVLLFGTWCSASFSAIMVAAEPNKSHAGVGFNTVFFHTAVGRLGQL